MKKIKYLLFLLFLLPFIYFTEVNANEGEVEGDNDDNQVEEVVPDEEDPGDSSNNSEVENDTEQEEEISPPVENDNLGEESALSKWVNERIDAIIAVLTSGGIGVGTILLVLKFLKGKSSDINLALKKIGIESETVDTITTKFDNGVTKMEEVATNIKDKTEQMSEKLDGMRDKITEEVTEFKNSVSGEVNALKDGLNLGMENFKNSVENDINTFKQLANKDMNGLKQEVNKQLTGLKDQNELLFSILKTIYLNDKNLVTKGVAEEVAKLYIKHEEQNKA